MKGTHISKKAQRKMTGIGQNLYCMGISALLKEIDYWGTLKKDRYAINRTENAKDQLRYLTRA